MAMANESNPVFDPSHISTTRHMVSGHPMLRHVCMQMAEELHWRRLWQPKHHSFNFDMRRGPIATEWFKGGQTNMCYNCLDRWVEAGRGNQACFLWEGMPSHFSGQSRSRLAADLWRCQADRSSFHSLDRLAAELGSSAMPRVWSCVSTPFDSQGWQCSPVLSPSVYKAPGCVANGAEVPIVLACDLNATRGLPQQAAHHWPQSFDRSM